MNVAPIKLVEAEAFVGRVGTLERDDAKVPRVHADTRGHMPRPSVRGKFLFVGEEKFWIRGVTYGTFKPNLSREQFPPRDVVARDFRAIADAGLNAIRVYTTPPVWLMNTAATCGLRVMIGLPWEQHITFLDDRSRAERIVGEVRNSVRRLAHHPALLCYAVGNEIPPTVVRWYGKARIERFIARLYDVVKSEDPETPVTYVNFPTTEYFDLPFVDFVSFNIYLESREQLSGYLARLQNLAGERPLVMTEIGLDSRRNGEIRQAETLDWQVATAFEAGCAGAFVFSWTDEWFRGGHDITDWDFGLTTRDRRPKPALQSVATRFANVPFSADSAWPRISVIVCSFNGSRTIGETLNTLEKLDYPDYEIIVVDDGSRDKTGLIANRKKIRLFRTGNNGLSAARNLGLREATGEIVAYIDDDAYPDPHWLLYLASAFRRTEHAGIGGPNIATPDDGVVADCVANAPGAPTHVLLTDELAEHIPGCNMAFRRDRLMAIDGFDPRFRVAGDDVDICWRLQERGWTLGFAPTAVVWHHRRNSLQSYFKQQLGYANAEKLLADKWPAKYNNAGHLNWQGRLYGQGVVECLFQRSRVYHGVWGTAPFQSIYAPSHGRWSSLMLMPEWYCVLAILGFLTALGILWSPLLWLSLPLLVASSLTLFQAAYGGYRARFHSELGSWLHRFALRSVVAGLHLVQPVARLIGRMKLRLGPWNWKGTGVLPLPSVQSLWCEKWNAIECRLSELTSILQQHGTAHLSGGNFDSWDLLILGGLFGSARMVAMVEEHGDGRQLCRFRTHPMPSVSALVVFLALVILACLAVLDHALAVGALLALGAAGLGVLIYADCANAICKWRSAVDEYVRRDGNLHVLSRSTDAQSGDAKVKKIIGTNSWPAGKTSHQGWRSAVSNALGSRGQRAN